jgi:hypothetical protein
MVAVCTNRFNIQKFCVLPTELIYVFCTDLRTNCNYFLVQLKLIGLCNQESVYCVMQTESLSIIQVNLSL